MSEENIRNTKRYSLAPLTPEEALRKAMQFKPPAPAPKKPPANAAKGKKKG
ncbi:MAG: hypothetical protein IAF94_07130 [Pirellulaceae bacterium]|nr:hypothetical protein [Pirellulaceae bacterium]